MPSTAIGSVAYSTVNTTRKALYNQIFDGHPLGWHLNHKEIAPWEGGGDTMYTNVLASKNQTVAFRDYKVAVPLEEYDPLKRVGLTSAFIDGALKWFDHDEEENVGPGAVQKFVTTMTNGTIDTMKDVISLAYWHDNLGYDLGGTAAYANSGTNLFFHGLPNILDNGFFAGAATPRTLRATYQTLARTATSNQFWCANSGDNGVAATGFTDANGIVRGPFNTSEALSMSGGTDGGIERLYNMCCENGGFDPPDLGFCHVRLYEQFKSLIKANELLQNQKLMDAGLPANILWNTATIFWDNNAPYTAATTSGAFMFLNTRYLHIVPYAGYDREIQVTPVQDRQVVGEWSHFIMTKWRGNIVCDMPRRQGMMENKTHV